MATTNMKFDKHMFSKSEQSEHILKNKTFIIVEDSHYQRKLLRGKYEKIGMKCIGEASNGLEALHIIEKNVPDLISSDILMPEMHGIELLKIVKEQNIKSVFILVTALNKIDNLNDEKNDNWASAIFYKNDSIDIFKSILEDIFVSMLTPNNIDNNLKIA